MDELEALASQGLPKLMDMARKARELAAEQKPAAPAIGRCPDVREAGDRACVNDRAGLAEEICGRPGRAVDVRLELRPIELADQIGEGLRCATELRAVMDEENPGKARMAHEAMLAAASAGLRFLHDCPSTIRRMARVGVDGLMISPRGKGLARVQRHSLEVLAARGDHELVAFVRAPVDIPGVEVVQIRSRPTLAWELAGVSSAVRRHRLDAFLTYSERLPLRSSVPIVVWLFESPVHRIEQNRLTGASLWHRGSDAVTALMWKRSLRETAAHVAMGSRATEIEVVSAVPGLRGRTSVVHPGLAPGFEPGPSSRSGYVFHLGSNDPRDNTAVAVEACRRAGATLVVAGGWDGDGAEAVGRVSDDELLDLYRGAAVFLDPTLYEGFGYGVLEAMACGAPVVASNTTSIPEVVGDAGILCDPRDADALAKAVRRVLDEPRAAAEMRARGLARAAEFTRAKTGDGLRAAIAAAVP